MQPQLIRDLVALLGQNAVLSEAEDLMLYEYDGSVELGSPKVIVFPCTTGEVAEIVRLANRHNTPLVGRGAGTGSGSPKASCTTLSTFARRPSTTGTRPPSSSRDRPIRPEARTT